MYCPTLMKGIDSVITDCWSVNWMLSLLCEQEEAQRRGNFIFVSLLKAPLFCAYTIKSGVYYLSL